MFELEKYHGGKSRQVCPACNAKRSFARYQDENGEYISFDVGRCNRESKCGYHFTPKMFFELNPKPLARRGKPDVSRQGKIHKNGSKAICEAKDLPKKTDFIDFDIFLRTLANYEQNAFVQFLLKLFSEDAEIVWQAVKNYFVGTSRDGKTIFWQIDQTGKIRTGKIIAYDASTGKRRKDVFPNWTHAELKKAGVKDDFNLKQCFFGEHLLSGEKAKPVAIVEAEKTAVIASVCFPEFVWLACGAKQNLKAERLKRFENRQIFLYPDADAYEIWRKVVREARQKGLSVNVSDLIENQSTQAEKDNGADLADYLIAEQKRINMQNLFSDSYNETVHRIVSDQKLFQKFNEILDEHKVNWMYNSNLSEWEAEAKVSEVSFVRQIVLQFIPEELEIFLEFK